MRLDRAFATAIAVAFAVLPGCGGQSMRQTDDAEAGDGGSSGDGGSWGNGGSSVAGTSGTVAGGVSGTGAGGVSGTGAVPAGGTSGTAGKGGCIYAGNLYPLGTSFPAADGCNTCSCGEGGVVACTLIDCQVHCEWNGTFYAHGSRFPEPDGCGTCSCAYGEITCTSESCPPSNCDAISAAYSEFMLTSAKQCDPSIDIPQCINLVSSSLTCGCLTWVNDAAPLEAWRNAWEAGGCERPIPCPPCPAPALAANCSLDGICVDVR